MPRAIQFSLNGEPVEIDVDSRRPLLWVLRTELGLTGTKYGCGERECGACTVLLNGRPTFSCRTPLRSVQGREVTTIEGLAENGNLHPVQRAFADHDALQCGFCTPGMIMGAVGLLRRNVGANAIHDAVGVRLYELPMTPGRIRSAVADA
jgi:nicotinate dehydrogenase subunit A